MDKFKNKISDFFWNIKKTYLRGKGFVVRANHVDEGFEDYDIFGLYHQTYLINYSAPMEIISLLNINQHKDSDKHIILTSFWFKNYTSIVSGKKFSPEYVFAQNLLHELYHMKQNLEGRAYESEEKIDCAEEKDTIKKYNDKKEEKEANDFSYMHADYFAAKIFLK